MDITGADEQLLKAALTGDVKAARDALAYGANARIQSVDDKGIESWSPLHAAACFGQKAVADILLERGAQVDCTCEREKYTPLHLAAQGGHAELVRVLLECGADVNRSAGGGVRPIHLAAYKGSIDAMRLLIDARADVDACTFRNESPLDFAVRSGEMECVTLLVRAGCRADSEKYAASVRKIIREASESKVALGRGYPRLFQVDPEDEGKRSR